MGTTGVVTGVELMQGRGVAPARGFWADAWAQVLRRRLAVLALAWLSIVAFFAVFSPFLASGHPLWLVELGASGEATRAHSPFLRHLRPTDLAFPAWAIGSLAFVLWPSRDRGGASAGGGGGGGGGKGRRLGLCLYVGVMLGAGILFANLFQNQLFASNPSQWARDLRDLEAAPILVASIAALFAGAFAGGLPVLRGARTRLLANGIVALLVLACVAPTWNRPRIEIFPYPALEAEGRARATYTLIPFSPGQRYSELDRQAPGTNFGRALQHGEASPTRTRAYIAGTDGFGQDVLAQLLHACRLAISIGFVSTGIAVTIGVTLGAIAGYFGGLIDMLIQRLIEIFMSVPVLFLLIIASGVLPSEMRTTYVTMAIIGLVTWTGSARFTRAEFLKLRGQDFVQSARAVGLPLRSILFRHMLPNGVTPVLVDASFGIAAAILAEATLSYLGLGPVDSPSWGKLLTSAATNDGLFKWWLAVFPGLAIFLTVLSYNLLGETLRDAIDPKLKKARV